MTILESLPPCGDCMQTEDINTAILPDDTVVSWVGCYCRAPQVIHEHWKNLGYQQLPVKASLTEAYHRTLNFRDVAAPAEVEEPVYSDFLLDPFAPDVELEISQRQAVAEKLADAALNQKLEQAVRDLTEEEYALIEGNLPPFLQAERTKEQSSE